MSTLFAIRATLIRVKSTVTVLRNYVSINTYIQITILFPQFTLICKFSCFSCSHIREWSVSVIPTSDGQQDFQVGVGSLEGIGTSVKTVHPAFILIVPFKWTETPSGATLIDISKGEENMCAKICWHVFGEKLACTRTVLSPVCVITEHWFVGGGFADFMTSSKSIIENSPVLTKMFDAEVIAIRWLR